MAAEELSFPQLLQLFPQMETNFHTRPNSSRILQESTWLTFWQEHIWESLLHVPITVWSINACSWQTWWPSPLVTDGLYVVHWLLSQESFLTVISNTQHCHVLAIKGVLRTSSTRKLKPHWGNFVNILIRIYHVSRIPVFSLQTVESKTHCIAGWTEQWNIKKLPSLLDIQPPLY